MIRRRRLLPRAFALVLLILTATSASAEPATSATPEDIQRLVGTLNDPAARERLIGELNALLAAEHRQPPPTPTVPIDGWVNRIAGTISGGLATLTAEAPGHIAGAASWTVLVLVLLGIAFRALRRLTAWIARVLAADPTVSAPRAHAYLPLAHAALRASAVGLAATVILQAWGFDVWGWLQSSLGRRILSSGLSIAVIVALAAISWAIASVLIARSLSLGALDSPRLRAARLRTLLPLLRNILSVVIVVLTSLVVLSELGIDIAPLLAGAGVIGLAIGFGAQTLVKDLITGLFFLLEDTVNVGDVVDVGGRSGLVEGISIRSIRLRDVDGSVHTVPFSAVPAIKNMTKDFAYSVLDVFVDYRSDIERALAALREVDEAIRADPAFGAMILAPAEILGLERFADNAMVARARIKTLPLRRWEVGRELNRRVKLAFDRAGIGMVAAPPEDRSQKPEARKEDARPATH